MWPEGFAFPACKLCNAHLRIDEMVFAYYATLGDDQQLETSRRALQGLWNNAPDLLPRLMSGVEKRPMMRQLGIRPAEGLTVSDVPLVAVPVEARRSILKCLTKLTCALVYREMGMIAPKGTAFWSFLRSNAELHVDDPFSYIPFKFDRPVSPTVQRRDVGHIFRYMSATADDRSAFAMACRFGSSFLGFGFAILDTTQIPKHSTDDEVWTNALGEPLEPEPG